MANRSVGRRVVRATKRSMFWEGAQVNFSLATGLTSATAIVSESTLENIPEPTLIRVRGQVSQGVSAQSGTPATALISYGLIVVTAKAFAAGAASLPAAGTDIGSDWLWHSQVPVIARSAVGVEVATGPRESRFEIDNKAMRKIGNNQLLVLIVENVALTSTLTVLVTAGFRVLFKK